MSTTCFKFYGKKIYNIFFNVCTSLPSNQRSSVRGMQHLRQHLLEVGGSKTSNRIPAFEAFVIMSHIRIAHVSINPIKAQRDLERMLMECSDPPYIGVGRCTPPVFSSLQNSLPYSATRLPSSRHPSQSNCRP